MSDEEAPAATAPPGGMYVAADESRPCLTDEQAQRLLKLVHEKMNPNTKCEMCGTDDWELPDQLIAAPVVGVNKEGIPYAGDIAHRMLFGMLICQRCGNTKSINLEAIGFHLATSQ